MKRRDVLKYTSLMIGGALAAPVASSLLIGCQSAPKAIPFEPAFFSKEQYKFIEAICGSILPDGEVPGAVQVGVPQVIDHMVGKVYGAEDRDQYAIGLGFLMGHWNTGTENGFVQMTGEEKLKKLEQIEVIIKAKALEKEKNPAEETPEIAEAEESDEIENQMLTEAEKMVLRLQAYAQLKQQTIAYFLSSEEISTNHLNYLPVPGKYEACITLEEVGTKAWAI